MPPLITIANLFPLCRSFIVQDEKYNYISGRFPPDAALLAAATIEMVNNVISDT